MNYEHIWIATDCVVELEMGLSALAKCLNLCTNIGEFLLFLKITYLPVPSPSCSTWDPVPWAGIGPRPLALGAWNLSHWTTREVPSHYALKSEKKDFKNSEKTFYAQIRSVAQSCPTLCDPMNRSTPGLPVRHQLPEFTETHIHRVSDAIQLSHPLSSPSPPAPNPSQHQSLFQWVNSSHEVAKVLEFQL